MPILDLLMCSLIVNILVTLSVLDCQHHPQSAVVVQNNKVELQETEARLSMSPGQSLELQVKGIGLRCHISLRKLMQARVTECI